MTAPSSKKGRVADGMEEGHAHSWAKVEEKEVLQVAMVENGEINEKKKENILP